MPPTMSRLSAFFKDADSELGVLYPRHHIIAVFPSLSEADGAKAELKNAGCTDEDVITVSGEEMLQFVEEHSRKVGLSGAVMTGLSRIIGTEAEYTDKDVAEAKKGAAFLAVHCRTKENKTEVWKLLEARHPLLARYYSLGGIEHLAGES